jgi:hypothetical protein
MTRTFRCSRNATRPVYPVSRAGNRSVRPGYDPGLHSACRWHHRGHPRPFSSITVCAREEGQSGLEPPLPEDLVVLSGCETALGAEDLGQGPVVLVAAFQQTGAGLASGVPAGARTSPGPS